MTKLEKLIKQKGLSVYKLSLIANMSRITIVRLCDRKTTLSSISVDSAISICNALNCKLSDIAEDDDKEFINKLKEFEKATK